MSGLYEPEELDHLVEEVKRMGGALKLRRRWTIAGGAGVVVVVLAVTAVALNQPKHRVVEVGSAPGPSSPTDSPLLPSVSPTPSSPRPEQSSNPEGALRSFLEQVPGAGVNTGVQVVGGAPVSIVEVTGTAGGHEVDVVALGSTPALVARLNLPGPSFDFAATPILSGDVTGDGRPDFLVILETSQRTGVLVSNEGGTWHLVPISSTDRSQVYVGLNPTLSDGVLTSIQQSCVPTCAAGHQTTVTWTYVHAGDYLKAS